MKEQSSGGLRLPSFQRNQKQQDWVASERRTAKLIRSLWEAAGQQQRSDPAFLCLLVQCGWTNAGKETGRESTRRWRNHNIAEYLRVPYDSDRQLAEQLNSRFKSIGFAKCLSFVSGDSFSGGGQSVLETLGFEGEHP